MTHALRIDPGDEVIVPAMTFAASANCVAFQGGAPVFVDVEPETLLIDPEAVEAAITRRTRAIIAVDYAGQPCDYDRLRSIADRRGLDLAADACHSLGGAYHGAPVGSLARMSAFSFHPVKPLTTGEGGMVTTDDAELAERMRRFRNHGITADHRQRGAAGTWFYEMTELGFNYRLTDLQCALGTSQLRRLVGWTRRRQQIASLYDSAFAELPGVQPLRARPGVSHARHLYVVRWRPAEPTIDRAEFFRRLRAAGVGANVHYIPVHLHPFYRREFGTRPGMCPAAERAYEEILSLPIFPRMRDQDVRRVVETVAAIVRAAQRLAA
jgi:perosamine synthetase